MITMVSQLCQSWNLSTGTKLSLKPLRVKYPFCQNCIFYTNLLPFTGVVFSCYFVKYGVLDLILWSFWLALISSWFLIGQQPIAEYIYLVKFKSISFFNFTAEATVCGQTNLKQLGRLVYVILFQHVAALLLCSYQRYSFILRCSVMLCY